MSAAGDIQPLDLQVRYFVYRFFADNARPPSVEEAAGYFDFSVSEAQNRYHRLSENHFFYLEPGTDSIRMANPFSALPTDFQVTSGGRTYFANCAWDMLGIPSALGTDARIEARCAGSGEPLGLEITAGRLSETAGVVHFLVPFRDWYTDLVFT